MMDEELEMIYQAEELEATDEEEGTIIHSEELDAAEDELMMDEELEMIYQADELETSDEDVGMITHSEELDVAEDQVEYASDDDEIKAGVIAELELEFIADEDSEVIPAEELKSGTSVVSGMIDDELLYVMPVSGTGTAASEEYEIMASEDDVPVSLPQEIMHAMKKAVHAPLKREAEFPITHSREMLDSRTPKIKIYRRIID